MVIFVVQKQKQNEIFYAKYFNEMSESEQKKYITYHLDIDTLIFIAIMKKNL